MKYWYHYSKTDYCGPDFEAGTHFGTLEAAHDRWDHLRERGDIRAPGCLVEVRLFMYNPYRTYDQGTWQSPTAFYGSIADEKSVAALVNDLGYEWPWGADQYAKLEVLEDIDDSLSTFDRPFSGMTYDEMWREVILELSDQGYDGIEYKNTVEDVGSTSRIIFGPGQAEVVGIAPLPTVVTERWWREIEFEDEASFPGLP